MPGEIYLRKQPNFNQKFLCLKYLSDLKQMKFDQIVFEISRVAHLKREDQPRGDSILAWQ